MNYNGHWCPTVNVAFYSEKHIKGVYNVLPDSVA